MSEANGQGPGGPVEVPDDASSLVAPQGEQQEGDAGEQETGPAAAVARWHVRFDPDADGYVAAVSVEGIEDGEMTCDGAGKLAARIAEAEQSARLAVRVAQWLHDAGVTDEDTVGTLVRGAVDTTNRRALSEALGRMFGAGGGLFG